MVNMRKPKISKDLPKGVATEQSEEIQSLTLQVINEFESARFNLQSFKTRGLEDLKLWKLQRTETDDEATRNASVKDVTKDTTLRSGDIYITTSTLKAHAGVDPEKVIFLSNSNGDTKKVDAINKLRENDIQQMGLLDIEDDYTTHKLLFGLGFRRLDSFDIKTSTPVCEVINPLVAYFPTSAKSIQGDGSQKRGRSSYFGWDEIISKGELESISKDDGWDTEMVQTYINGINENKERTNKSPSPTENDILNITRELQNINGVDSDEQINGDSQILFIRHWYTFRDGKLLFLTLSSNFDILRMFEYENMNHIPVFSGNYIKTGNIIGQSVPGLIRDKQYTRSQLLSVFFESVKRASLPPMGYNGRSITESSVQKIKQGTFFDRGSDQGAITPMPTAAPDGAAISFSNSLDVEISGLTAATSAKQGETVGRSTATETAITNQGANARIALSNVSDISARVAFWEQWLNLYSENIPAVKEKIINVIGHSEDITRETIDKDTFDFAKNPTVFVTSKAIDDRKKFEKFSLLQNVIATAFRINPQIVNSSMVLKQLFELVGFSGNEVDQIIFESPHESIAKRENEMMQKNDEHSILPAFEDDDNMHIAVHKNAPQNAAVRGHIRLHQMQLTAKQELPPAEGRENVRASTIDSATRGQGQEQQGPSDLGGTGSLRSPVDRNRLPEIPGANIEDVADQRLPLV